MKKFVGIIFVISIILAAGAGFGIYQEYQRPGPHTEDRVVLITPGMGVSQIAEVLGYSSVIHSNKFFIAVVKAKGVESQLRAGEFSIPVGATYSDVIDILINGKSILHKLTIAEGLTTVTVLRLVNEDEVLVGETSLEPTEGALLPETYLFTRGDSRDDIIKRMMNDHTKVLDELWPARADDLPFETKEEAVILASIVEKETGISGERAKVASVFINRLERPMRLQSDPTIIYGLTGGAPLGRGIRQSELKKKTPYNTYVIDGLPPTPIANPGRSSIAAVLNPADTDYLYFVADGTGGHVFASSLREHNRNVAKWRAEEKKQRD